MQIATDLDPSHHTAIAAYVYREPWPFRLDHWDWHCEMHFPSKAPALSHEKTTLENDHEKVPDDRTMKRMMVTICQSLWQYIRAKTVLHLWLNVDFMDAIANLAQIHVQIQCEMYHSLCRYSVRCIIPRADTVWDVSFLVCNGSKHLHLAFLCPSLFYPCAVGRYQAQRSETSPSCALKVSVVTLFKKLKKKYLP